MIKERACCEEVCKQDFPKTRRLNHVGRVICPGVARRFKAQVKGRRNSLCLLLPRRRCAWLSGCSPVHSWAEVEWRKAGPKGGMPIQMGNKNGDMSSMAAKMELCRWLFIDEVEAVGAEILGVMEQHTSEAARRRLYKFRGDKADPLHQRCFGGLNLHCGC